MSNWASLQEQLIGKPVYKRAKHGIHFQQADGSILANFSGKPCHYLDTDGLWKPIDTKLIQIGTEYGAPGLKPRITKSGLVRIDGTDYSQQSTRIGIFNPTTKKFTAIKTIPLGSLAEDKLIAESGVWRRELRLTETGLKEEIIIASKPTNTGATLSDWLVLETAVSGMSVPDGWLNDYEVGEFKFPPPSAHDSSAEFSVNHNAACKRYAKTVNGVQYLYTGVSAVWLNSAVYPVVIDPDLNLQPDPTDGKDTSIYAGAGNSNRGISVQLNFGMQWAKYRALIQLVVSSIASGATIDSADLSLYISYAMHNDTYNHSVHRSLVEWYEGIYDDADPDAGEIYSSTWNARARTKAGDVLAWGAQGGQSGTDYAATATATTAITTASTWKSWDIKADVTAWVEGTATNYGIWLIADNESNESCKGFYSSDYTDDTSLRPKLAVTYTEAAAGNPHYYFTQQ